MIFRNFHYIYHHHYHHHLCFNVCFSCLHGLDGILWKTSLLFQITSDCLIPSFPRLLYRDTTTNHDQAFSYALSTWPNHRSLLSCKNSHYIKFIILSSSEILSSGLTLHINLTIPKVYFLSSMITSSCLTGQVSLPYSITLRTHAKYHLHFAPDSKTLLANKSAEISGLTPSNLDLCFHTIHCTPSNLYYVLDPPLMSPR